MHAAFVAQLPKHILAAHLENNLAITAEHTRAAFDALNRQPRRFRVAQIHPVKVRRKNRRLVATGACADFHDGVAVLVRVRRQQSHLHLALQLLRALFQLRQFRLRHLGQFIRALRHFEVLGILAGRFFKGIPRCHCLLQPSVFTQKLLRTLRVVVEIRLGDGFLDFKQAFAFSGNERCKIHVQERRNGGNATAPPPSQKSNWNELGLDGLRRAKRRGAVTLRELLDAACGIHEFLLAREERMAGCTDTDFQIAARGAGAIAGTASAVDGRLFVVRMDVGFHNNVRKRARKLAAHPHCANKKSRNFSCKFRQRLPRPVGLNFANAALDMRNVATNFTASFPNAHEHTHQSSHTSLLPWSHRACQRGRPCFPAHRQCTGREGHQDRHRRLRWSWRWRTYGLDERRPKRRAGGDGRCPCGQTRDELQQHQDRKTGSGESAGQSAVRRSGRD